MLRIDSNIIWIIVNLLIFYFLIRKFLFKRVLDMIEKRKEMIDGQFADAKAANDEALELKSQYETSIRNAKEEGNAIVERARKRAEAQSAEIISAAQAQSQQMIERTNKNIERQQERALQDVQSQISVLAMAAAAKIIGDTSNPGTDDAIYNEFLMKAGEQHDSNSH